MGYVVTLRDLPGITPEARDSAQKRFRERLEKQYGSPDKVAAALRVRNAVDASGGKRVSLKDTRTADTFNRFAEVARKVGIQGLQGTDLAYFAVSLAC